jgi:lysophospholipase L1-like esterase
MNRPSIRRRAARLRQLVLPFVVRRLRHERQFKRAILAATGLAVIAIVQAIPWGHHLSASIDTWARRIFSRSLRPSQSRAERDESWRSFRLSSIERMRPQVERFFGQSDPALQKLMRYAGMDPEHGLLRWGNYDWTLLLSSKVFEPDDRLSFRMRPGVRSIWLMNLTTPAGGGAFFLVPDGPGLAEAIRGTPAIPRESSRQTTNSWGLRGPEPDPDAPLRGIVLGDSYMQGMFIGDDDAPPERLRRYLQGEVKGSVSILNAGVMGYSPEQYYYSLRAFADRFRPHFVVVSLFANDCGNVIDATGRGVGDWREGKYWLDKIIQDCKAHDRPYLLVPAPYEWGLLGKRQPGYYPGTLANVLNLESPTYLDPTEDFLNAHLQSRVESRREGRTARGCSLFNDDIKDSHFSAAGSEVWAESVGRRLVLLLEDRELLPAARVSGRDGGRPPSGGAGLAQARVGSD